MKATRLRIIMSVGTGKTVVGVKIACLFAKMNEHNGGKCQSGARKQVLFCGSSNCSVDVVAGTMS